MDATKKPLLIPPEFSNYAEKHGIFQIYEVRDWLKFVTASKIQILILFLSANNASEFNWTLARISILRPISVNLVAEIPK